MPALDNPRHEAFAAAGTKGATLRDAFEGAGVPPDRAHRRTARGAGRVGEYPTNSELYGEPGWPAAATMRPRRGQAAADARPRRGQAAAGARPG